MDVYPWILVLVTAALSQAVKFVLYGLVNQRFSLRVLVTTNGMPSLYAVTFGCLATMVWWEHGHWSPRFVAVFVLAGIILHDAVRLQGSMDQGGRAALLVAERLTDNQRHLEQLRPYLGDRGHRPLHIVVGLILGTLAGLAWGPLVR